MTKRRKQINELAKIRENLNLKDQENDERERATFSWAVVREERDNIK
jgi:hypothetical protein